MGKAAVVETKEPETLPAVRSGPPLVSTGSSNIVSADLTDADKYAGEGVSTRAEDNLIPLIYVLQPNSPQVNKRNEAYIEGAEPGDIWLRNAPNPIVKGAEGVWLQPCKFWVDFVEWIPRDDGGGFVGRHTTPPSEATLEQDPDNKAKKVWRMPNGNEVIETRNHAVIAMTEDGALPYLLPFTSTGHSVSKQWMGQINQKFTPSGKKAAAFNFYYRLRTRLRKNKDGEWFLLEVMESRQVEDNDALARGHALKAAFDSGEKEVAMPTSGNLDDGPDGGQVPF